MLDDTEAPEKPTLAPKPEPTPICTLMSDRSLKLQPGATVSLLDVQSLLLSAAASLTLDVVRRAMNAERVLGAIQQKFNLTPDIEAEINQIISRP